MDATINPGTESEPPEWDSLVALFDDDTFDFNCEGAFAEDGLEIRGNSNNLNGQGTMWTGLGEDRGAKRGHGDDSGFAGIDAANNSLDTSFRGSNYQLGSGLNNEGAPEPCAGGVRNRFDTEASNLLQESLKEDPINRGASVQTNDEGGEGVLGLSNDGHLKPPAREVHNNWSNANATGDLVPGNLNMAEARGGDCNRIDAGASKAVLGNLDRAEPQLETLDNVDFQSSNLAFTTSKGPKSFTLRHWIKHVLHSLTKTTNDGKRAALSSQAYLESAIKIALALTNQVEQAEKLVEEGGRVELLPKSTAADWAAHVIVRLKKERSSSLDGQRKSQEMHRLSEDLADDFDLKPIPHSTVATAASVVDGAGNAQVANEQLEALGSFSESILKSLGVQEPLEVDEDGDGWLHPLKDVPLARECEEEDGWIHPLTDHDINLQVDPFMDSYENAEPKYGGQSMATSAKFSREHFEPPMASFRLDGPVGCTLHNDTVANSPSQSDPCLLPPQEEYINFLDIDSAEIRTSDINMNMSNHGSNTYQDESQRIFYLGLVLYELFSGGELAPPDLRTLASCDGAFTSLSTMTLMKKNDNEDEDPAGNSKRHQSSAASLKEAGLCKLSCDYLQLIGVPCTICHLVFNMLSCVHGDLGGDESYSRIDDITLDLQLMLDKPKFLKGLDMNQLSSTGLQLNEINIPREHELECIKNCYHRCIEGSSEVVIIKGESGAGKSTLAQRVGSFVSSDGGIFLFGKFDQLHQSKPFSALTSAFDQCCDFLMRSKNAAWAKAVVAQLKVAIGLDANYLVRVIPKLDLILEVNGSDSVAMLDMNCRNAVQRLHFLICKFLEVIAANSQVSLTLFLDDVQWIDGASQAVLNRLLRQRHRKFFFLVCCREDEMPPDHQFWKLESTSVTSTHVKINCMREEMLNDVMSDLLCLSPRLVRPLSCIVFSKTKGNPLFFSQLILSLNRDRLLYLDFEKRRWKWDEEKILSMRLPENIAICFSNGINRLEPEVQFALHMLSMFGSSVKCQYVGLLESRLDLNLTEPLKTAAMEGLVIRQNESFFFTHDRIQESSYNRLGQGLRSSNHLMYGMCLAECACATGDDDMLFTGVGQINLAGPMAVSDKPECFTLAKLNVAAGKKAINMADFTFASTLFGLGWAFLRRNENHWNDHYDFSLELFECACQSALASNNISGLLILADEVMNHARSFEDKLSIHYIVVSSQVHSNQFDQALENCLAIVGQLGEELPSNPSNYTLDLHIQQTQAMLQGTSEEYLLNHKTMTDHRKLMVMKFLGLMQSIGFFMKPILHTCIITKMVQVTILHGISPASPVAFTCFGSYLAKLGNIKVGYRFTSLAKSLLSKLNSMEVAGEVICLASEVQCYVEPMQALHELKAEGERAAISVGNFHWACLNRASYCFGLLWGGTKLDVVYEKVTNAHMFIKSHDQNVLVFIQTLARSLDILLGKETVTSRSGLSQLLQVPRQKMIRSFHNLYLALLFNDANLKEYCEQFFESERKSCTILFGDSVQSFTAGLAAFQIYRQTGDTIWADRGRKRKEELAIWKEQGSLWNFQHKLFLMMAEEHYSHGNFQCAEENYKNAIICARAHKFINDEALAYELAAKFYLGIGNLSKSMEHFRLSHERYLEWGAVGKASQLFVYIHENFASVLTVGRA